MGVGWEFQGKTKSGMYVNVEAVYQYYELHQCSYPCNSMVEDNRGTLYQNQVGKKEYTV
jgi:hypothetical protein